jgi:hypothetical protein
MAFLIRRTSTKVNAVDTESQLPTIIIMIVSMLTVSSPHPLPKQKREC